MKRSAKAPLGRHDCSRMFRNVIEIASKLENATSRANCLSNIFNESVNSLRHKLVDDCETLLLWAPIEFGRKVEDMLWRKCYHDVMQYYKKNKRRMPSEDMTALQMHLTSGMGHYYNLLIILAKHYKIDLQKLLPYITSVANIDDYVDASEEHTDEVLVWAKQAIHRILIYLGDLARYLYDLELSGYRDLSIRFYDAALIWNPEIGMPFNQLGTLSDANNYGLDSVYYYLRCISCNKPFEGAENNLRRVFETNEKQFSQFENEVNGDESFKVVKRAILQFLKLCNEYWFAKQSDNQFVKNVLPIVQEVLYSFKAAFNLKSKLSTDHMPTYLNSSIIFEVTVIALLIANRVEVNDVAKHSESENASLSSIVTFCINFMMSVIECCHQNLRTKLGTDNSKTNDSINLIAFKETTPEMSPRRTLSRLRRRKAAINYDDKNLLSIDADDDSELSELEETALSTIDALEIGSDISDTNYESDAENIDSTIVSSDDDNSIDAKSNANDITIKASLLPAEELMNYILNESFLPTIKLYCDWLRSNPNVLNLSSSQLQVYFEEFVSFVNTLISIEEKVLTAYPELSQLKCFGANWTQKYPLPSDLSLSNIKFLRTAFRELDFESSRTLSNIEKGFVCIESIVAFAHFLTDLKHYPNMYGIAYDTNESRFTFHGYSNGRLSLYNTNTWSDSNPVFLSNYSQPINNEHTNSNESDHNNADESKNQKKFMKDMAELWLKSEVSKLEKDVMNASLPQLPPYLVLDSTVFCEHLNLVKDLAASKRFILVIPKIVLTGLDKMKKMSANAREAIRWLEDELHRGNRVIKFPKDYEKLNLSPMKYPKRKDKEACDYYELLEYCNYYNKNSFDKNDSKLTNGMPMVTLLTHSFNKLPANAQPIAKSSGVHIETINSFLPKWKNISKVKT